MSRIFKYGLWEKNVSDTREIVDSNIENTYLNIKTFENQKLFKIQKQYRKRHVVTITLQIGAEQRDKKPTFLPDGRMAGDFSSLACAFTRLLTPLTPQVTL